MMPSPNALGAVRLPISLKIFGIAVGILLMMIVVTVLSSIRLGRVSQQLDLLADYYIELDQHMGDIRAQSLRELMQMERVLHSKTKMPADFDATAQTLYKDAGNCEPESLRLVTTKISSLYPQRGERQLMQYEINRRCTNARLEKANALVDKALLLPQVRDNAGQVARFTGIKSELGNIPSVRAKLHENFVKYLARLDAADPQMLAAMQDQIDERRQEMNRRLVAVLRVLHAGTQESAVLTKAEERSTEVLSWSVTAAACVLGLVVAFFLTRNLVRPVRELLGLTDAIRSGNLAVDIHIKTGDEIGLLADSFNHMVGEMRQKEQIMNMFGKYVDPRIVQGLLIDKQGFSQGGERRHMSVFFSDLEGFTAVCEALTPTGAVRLLSQYFTLMAQPIRTHHGIVDKYIGDSVMAFWGPPFSSPTEHAAQACFAALEQQALVPTFQAMLPEILGIRKNVPEIRVRMGIATGDVTVGSIGSEDVRSYTVIGDNVNLASRLEGANKHYQTQILISEDTRRLAGELIEAREIDAIRVVGKSEPVRIFELLARRGDVSPKTKELCDLYARALQLFRARQWDQADATFDACLRIQPSDGPSKVFKDRIVQGRSLAATETWDGVWNMLEK